MDNRPPETKGFTHPIFRGCLISIIYLFAFLFIFTFGLYLFSKNLFLAFLYFVATYLLVRKWRKIKKAQAEAERVKIEERKRLLFQARLKEPPKFSLPVWKKAGYSSNAEYLAEKERKIRKREQDYLLARAYRRRQGVSTFKKNLTTVDNLLKLTPTEFEKWVKSNVFEKEGWRVTETKITGDGGVDLVLKRKNEHSIVQCKRYKHTIGEPLLRDFYGTMISEGVSRGYFVTTGLFSLSALKFADNKPIELIDRRVLAQRYLS